MVSGQPHLASLALGVRIEIAIAEAESEPARDLDESKSDPLYLRIGQWALTNEDFAGVLPVRDQNLRILAFDYDISDVRGARTAARSSRSAHAPSSYVRHLQEKTVAGIHC